MKRVFFTFAVLAILSCTKDEVESSKEKNYFEIDGVEYELSGGAIANFGFRSWADGFYFDLVLHTNGIIFSDNTDSDFIGTGDLISFEIISANKSDIKNEIYILDKESSVSPAGTMRSIYYYLNAKDYYYSDKATTGRITTGTLTINKTDNVYEISFDCIDLNGKIVKGYYKGVLVYFDFS